TPCGRACGTSPRLRAARSSGLASSSGSVLPFEDHQPERRLRRVRRSLLTPHVRGSLWRDDLDDTDLLELLSILVEPAEDCHVRFRPPQPGDPDPNEDDEPGLKRLDLMDHLALHRCRVRLGL